MRPPFPPPLAALARRQAGVLSRGQLRAAGVDRWQVRNQVEAQRWRRVGPRVVVLHTGGLTRLQQAWVAVLHVGPGSALAGRTAAEFDGLTGWNEAAVHVRARRDGPRVPALPGLVIHTSRRGADHDIDRPAGPPRVRLPRALVDAATWSESPRAAVGLLASGVQQRLVTAESLRQVVATLGPVRHRRLLLLTLADIEGGSQALSELDLVEGCRARGLPVPERQVVRMHRGRRRYLDAEFRRPDGSTFVVEIDGAGHLAVARWWDDLDRQNELVIGGDQVLRFPAARLRTDPDRCFEQIRRALRVRPAA